jgi:hypothetical protein
MTLLQEAFMTGLPPPPAAAAEGHTKVRPKERHTVAEPAFISLHLNAGLRLHS